MARRSIAYRWKNVAQFADLVTRLEGKKKSITTAQVKEVLKITNGLLNGDLYIVIRNHVYD